MAGKVDAQGNVKRIQWDENSNLIFATILDPRFKMGTYFDAGRHCEYKSSLINVAERTAMTDRLSEQFELNVVPPTYGESDDLFAKFEENFASTTVGTCTSPLTDPTVLSTRQKAEVEANDYLRVPKLPKNADPYQFWSGENEIKWPLLTKLAHRFLSAPATSAESERLFSTAGLIMDDLRKSLSAENVEKLLFLHHNLKIYNFAYE